jgi:glutamate/tyrosine decarboxylase-like PLP-dependent enzyme
MVVSILGTTELGNIDPIHEVQDIIDQTGAGTWHHIDAAYGGFFAPLRSSEDGLLPKRARDALLAVPRADSMTIDPHKLGYVPYACGAFLCRDFKRYSTELFDSPYIQYESGWDPGPFTLEGSRSASGAAATWLTLRAIGTGAEGYGRIMARTIRLRIEMEGMLKAKSPRIRVLPHHHTNILCFTLGKTGEALSKANAWVEDFYRSHSGDSGRFFVSKTALPLSGYSELTSELFRGWSPVADAADLHLIRLTLMNPFLRSKEMTSQIMEEFCVEVVSNLRD